MLQCTARCSLMHYMTSRTSGFRPSVRLSHEQLTRDSIYTCIANMLSSVHPSLTHVHQSNTVKFRQWECITNIRLSISHTVDITFTACRQHVNISAVRIDYFCNRLLVDYLSTNSRLFFVQYTNYFSTLYVRK